MASEGKKGGPAIERRLIRGEDIMSKAKKHAKVANEHSRASKDMKLAKMPEEEMPKSAVKVSEKPKRIAKNKDDFSQKDSHDFVQQTEVDMMMPKPEAKEAP
jgi:hypothetical protein